MPLLAAAVLATLPSASFAAPGDFLVSLSNPSPEAGDKFGAVDRAMTGNSEVIYIGDPSDNTAGTDAGAVHVFDAETGVFLRTILNPDAQAGDGFGEALAVAPDGTLVVGTPHDDTSAEDAGIVYLFAPGASTPTRTLTHPEPGAGQRFGFSVAASGNRIAVGAPGPVGASDSTDGAVYVFDPATGDFLYKVANTSETYNFGSHVALTETRLAAGTQLHNAANGSFLRPMGQTKNPVSLARVGENFLLGERTTIAFTDITHVVHVYHGATGELLKSYSRSAYAGDTDYPTSFGGSLTSLEGNPAIGFSNYRALLPRESGALVLDPWGTTVFTTPGAGSEPVLVGSAGTRLLLSNPSATDTVEVFEGPAPAVAPAAPTGFSATLQPSGAEGGGFVTSLSWSDSPTTEAAFEIQRRRGTAPFATLAVISGLATSHTDLQVPGHTPEDLHTDLVFGYRLRAINLAHNSPFTSEQQVVVPAAPSNLRASVSDGVVTLTWEDNSAHEQAYRIERKAWDDSEFTLLAEAGPDTVTYGDTPPAAGKYYTYRVGVKRDTAIFYTNTADVSVAGPVAHHLKTLANPEPGQGAGFGHAVAAGAGLVAVGAPWADTEAHKDAGRVYVFDQATGNLRFILDSPEPQAGARFGWAVAFYRGNIIVGAPYTDSQEAGADAGAAYLFSGRNGWLLTSYTSPAAAANELFGWSVAPAGDSMLIGAPGNATGFAESGAVYVTDPRRKELRTLKNPTPAPADRFGWAVAAWGDQVVAVAPGDDSGAADSGSAWVFNWRNDALQARGDLAYSVAPAGNGLFVVGVLNGTGGKTPRTGFAWLLNPENGLPVRTFVNPVPADLDQFGYAVASSGTLTAVGVPQADQYFPDSGWVYVYNEATGTVNRRFDNPTPGGGDRFGHALAALDNGNFVVGAPGDDTGAIDAGAVYYFNAQP